MRSLSSNAHSHETGHYEQAESLLQQTLVLSEETREEDPAGFVRALHNLAHLYIRQGSYDRAESLAQRALTTAKASLDADHPYFAGILNALAYIYTEQGEYDRAESLAQRSLVLSETAPESNQIGIVESLVTLSNVERRPSASTTPASATPFKTSHGFA